MIACLYPLLILVYIVYIVDRMGGWEQAQPLHQKEKQPLPCRFCERYFTTVTGRVLHERLHTGQTFDCDKCDMKFTTKGNLERHRPMHLAGDARRRFQCERCQKRFTRMDTRNKHQRVCGLLPGGST